MTSDIQAHCNGAQICTSVFLEEKQNVQPSDATERLPGNFASGLSLITPFYYTINSGVAQTKR